VNSLIDYSLINNLIKLKMSIGNLENNSKTAKPTLDIFSSTAEQFNLKPSLKQMMKSSSAATLPGKN
jgi:hypothetical protein